MLSTDSSLVVRRAVAADLDGLRALMALAIDRLQSSFLSPEQVIASRQVMGLDTQLIADATYFLVETDDGRIAGCGGWSRRATLYGGDHSAGREPRLLDPVSEAARVRAMYTHPDFTRRGVGRLILATCEGDAKREDFTRAELMATLAGEPLYRAAGYVEIERIEDRVGDVPVPLVRMGKGL